MMQRSLHIILITLFGVLAARSQSVFFGDLHVHSTFSFDGKKGTPGEIYRYAKDSVKLDFIAITDHDTGSTVRQWDSSRYLASFHNQQGVFITLFGYEYTHRDGHRVVLFPDNSQAMRYASAVPVTDIYDSIRQADGITIIAHPNMSPFGSHIDYGNRSQGDLIEVIGMNGYRFEYSNNAVGPAIPLAGSAVRDWLMARKMMGIVGSSDNHEGRPGRTSLTGVWADTLTREEIFKSLRMRRTFATNGVRMKGRIMTPTHLMGDTVYIQQRGEIKISYELEGTAELQNFEVIKNGKVIRTIDAKGMKMSGSFSDKDTNTYAYYYLRVPQTGGGVLWTSPLFVIRSLPIVASKPLNPSFHPKSVSVAVHPNPFNGITTASIDMPEQEDVQISLYNLLGQSVVNMSLKQLPSGQSQVPIDLAEARSGVYVLKVKTSRTSTMTKLLHIK